MKWFWLLQAALTSVTAFANPVIDSLGAVSPLTIDVILRPVRGDSAEVTAVEVRWRLNGTLRPTFLPFSLIAPITYAGRTGIADRVDSLYARDSSGLISFTIEDDPKDPGGFPYFRHWRAQRRVVPPIVVSYCMLSIRGPSTPGPQFDFLSYNGGISSGGMALFVLPESIAVKNTRLRWDLSDLSPGPIAASTNGEGDFELPIGTEELVQAYYMAGPLGRYAPADTLTGFRAYWLGQPAFDPRREMAWTSLVYEYLRPFYQDTTTLSYRVFLRAYPGTGGGTALRNSFMLGTAPGSGDSAKTGPRGTLAHEMGHMWIGELSGGGPGGTTWFNEGLNVYYTRLLLLRSGLAPVSDYENDINKRARDYYTNPFKNVSADSIRKLGFSTGVGSRSAQNVPYSRGSMYFADVDAKVRAATGGRRKLDDVILALFEQRRNGEEITQQKLLDALVNEIGPAARKEFEAVIIRGETIVPESGAFGPGFERRPIKKAAEGQEVDGFEWVRVPSIPDSRCREW
jgi:predicted metalloprotease with PDZ domain